MDKEDPADNSLFIVLKALQKDLYREQPTIRRISHGLNKGGNNK